MKHIILLALLIVNYTSFSQYKIGNISLDSEIFNKYLAYCYLHPDTIQKRTMEYYEPIHWNAEHTFGYGDPITFEQSQRDKESLDNYNLELKKESIKEINGYYLIPRKPTEEDFIKWKYKNK